MNKNIKKLLIGLLVTKSETNADFICGANNSKCSVTCKNGGLHWSISRSDFSQYDHGYFRGSCDPVLSRDKTKYEMAIPFGSCGLKRKVWWSDSTIHYMYTQSFYSGRQFDTVQLTCSHQFNRNWTYMLNGSRKNEEKNTKNSNEIAGTTTTTTTTSTTTTSTTTTMATRSRHIEKIMAHYPLVNLKMASNRGSVSQTSSTGGANEDSGDEIAHYLEVTSLATTWGGRLNYKVTQNRVIPGLEFKITDCTVFSEGSEFSFPILTNEVGNHIVDFQFDTENSDSSSIEMSFKSFQFKHGNGEQTITCNLVTCDGECLPGDIESADSSIEKLISDSKLVISSSNAPMKDQLVQRLTRVGNNLVTVRQKVAKHCQHQIGFHDSRDISRMGDFDIKDGCHELRLIQAELMSWAQIFCHDCRMEHQARLGRLHHQISRAFEVTHKRMCK